MNSYKPYTKFKVGDKVICKKGTIDIWVEPGKKYEVLDIKYEPSRPGDICYRNCGHKMHDPTPERYFLVVKGKLIEPVTIFDGCFKKIK